MSGSVPCRKACKACALSGIGRKGSSVPSKTPPLGVSTRVTLGLVGVDSGCCWGYSAVGLGLTLADSSTSGNPISVQVALKVANHPSLTELWVVDIRKEPRLELG